LGTPNEDVWPGFFRLPAIQSATFVPQPRSRLTTKFPYLTPQGLDLLAKLLTYDPAQRISAEQALEHPYFR
jgi:cell division cycle 2-like protein